MKPLKLIISGGGTGGHIYPAIAIADTIKAIRKDAEILFVGAMGKMEMEKVPQAGYPIKGLWISGLQRKITLQNLIFPIKLLSSIFKANAIINEFKPDVVVGVGGYASGAIMKVATRQHLPTLIQEQNSYAGLTNKWVADQVDTICVAYPYMDKYFPASKIKLTGNPVRQDIWENKIRPSDARVSFGLDPNLPTLLVIGGSLGARTLNQALEVDWEKLASAGVQVLWQTGNYYYEGIEQRIMPHLPASIKVMPFISTMPEAYAAADVVVSRAGALSVSELSLTGSPTILVPSPNVAEDHQTKNAKALSSMGAAILVKDEDAASLLVDQALELLQNTEKQKEMRNAIQKLAKPNAAMDIAMQVIELAELNQTRR